MEEADFLYKYIVENTKLSNKPTFDQFNSWYDDASYSIYDLIDFTVGGANIHRYISLINILIRERLMLAVEAYSQGASDGIIESYKEANKTQLSWISALINGKLEVAKELKK